MNVYYDANLPIHYVDYFAWIKCVKVKMKKKKKENSRQGQPCTNSDQHRTPPSASPATSSRPQ